MPKVTIVGAGNVGATAAHALALKDIADIVLIDVVEGLPQGKALDMMQMRSVEMFGSKITGTNDYADTSNSDVVVITQALEASLNAIFICVTNPLDVMVYLAYKMSGLPSNRIMGMGAAAVCGKLGCDPTDVEAWAVGAHGEGMVCWPRFTTVKDTPITDLLEPAEVDEVVAACIGGGAKVVSLLKTGSAYYAPGASIAKMVEAILTDSSEVMSVCALLEGQYGEEGLFMNVPVRLGASGVQEIVEFDLNDDELAALHASAESVRAGLAGL